MRWPEPGPSQPGGATPGGATDGSGGPFALDWVDLPLPAEDERGPMRMLVLAALGGLGFWIVVGLLLI